MKKLYSFLLTAAVLLVSTASRADDLAYNVYQMKKAPVLDGKLDDEAWKDIPEATGFADMYTGKLSAARQSTFKIGHYNGNLYVAAKCYEPDTKNIKTDKNHYRDGWYPDDHLEFFVAKELKAKQKAQFVYNSQGSRWCNLTAHGTSDQWDAAASIGKDSWVTEVKIPLALAGIGKDCMTKPYYFNLARIANKNRSKEIYSCYAPVGTGFGNTAKYVKMNFKGIAKKAETSSDEKRLNRLGKWSKMRLWKMGYVKEDFLNKEKTDPATKKFLAMKQEAKKLLKEKDLGKVLSFISSYEKLSADLGRPAVNSIFDIKTKDAAVKVYVDGKVLDKNSAGKYEVNFVEGITTIAVECTAKGSDPKVALKLLSCSETDGNWKYSESAGKNWTERAFNDSKWKELKTTGFFWEKGAEKLYLRQHVLYNRSHDGPDRCLNPLVREWGFSLDSTEPIFLALYPPVKDLNGEYEFTLDLPAGFRLLDMKHAYSAGWWGSKVKMNCIPTSVTKKAITVKGKKYTRYVLKYAADDVSSKYTHPTILPVKLDSSRKAGEKDSFYFRRKQAGNFTELTQTLPVVILPAINGRMAKEFMVSMYCSRPYFGANVSDEALTELMKTAFKGGLNTWIHQPTTKQTPYFKLFKKLLADANVKQIAHFGNFPAWRGSLRPGELRSFVEKTPGARARYFNDFPANVYHSTDLKTLKKNWWAAAMYCPTYVTTAGREKFIQTLANDLTRYFDCFDGKLSAYWINWESEPWQASNAYLHAKTGLGSYCFCNDCKKVFYKSVGLPENSNISDEEIYKKYYNEWKLHRYKLDGAVQGLIREACNRIGLKYMVYSWLVQEPFWIACKGKIDYAFPGCPGNAPATSSNQEYMDKAMTFFREKLGMNKVLAQRFVFFGTYYSTNGPGGNLKYGVMSPDGYIDAKSWKSQLIRVAATMHGGCDLQSSMECIGGIMYWIGEATRAISDYEDLFLNGERKDTLAVSKDIKYPNLLVLTKGKERLILLFNEGSKPVTVDLENKSLVKGQKASIWNSKTIVKDPAKMRVTIPENDVILIHIK